MPEIQFSDTKYTVRHVLWFREKEIASHIETHHGSASVRATHVFPSLTGSLKIGVFSSAIVAGDYVTINYRLDNNVGEIHAGELRL